MSSVAVATLARETPPGLDPYRRTLAQLSSAGAPLASRGAGLDPLHVLAAVALLAGATAVLRHGRVAVDARHAAAPAVPQLPPVALGRPALATVSPARQAVRRRVAVAVMGPGGAIRQSWTVRVRPPQPPRIADAFPAQARVESVAGDEIRFALTAKAATPHERLRLTWTVDGTPAGKQESLTLHPMEPGTIVVRAVV